MKGRINSVETMQYQNSAVELQSMENNKHIDSSKIIYADNLRRVNSDSNVGSRSVRVTIYSF